MAPFDIAIHGRGLLPGLLAVHLLAGPGQLRVLLLAADRTVCGEQLEPVLPGKLDPLARAMVEPFCVKRWPGYFIAQGGAIDQVDEEVWLLDPVQVWLDLGEYDAACEMHADCSEVRAVGGTVEWNAGTAQAERFVDLSPLTGPAPEAEIIGMEAVRRLTLPILADYDTAAEGWEANQLLPLGDERVMARKLPLRDHLIAAHSTLETILNALLAD